MLMPIVSSMGCIAGTQTMTIVVRGMALGQIGPANVRWLLNRELQVALINGMLWALLVAGAATWSFQDMTLGAVIAAALIFNLLVAATAGALLPPTAHQPPMPDSTAMYCLSSGPRNVMGFPTMPDGVL